jgi:DNA segregation ATPase FtsK/SpoIIIE-like protein
VVTQGENVVPLLKNALSEMERRYRLFSQLNVRTLDGYRSMRLEQLAKGDPSLNNLPSIVIIINDLTDIMRIAAQEVKDIIDRLAQRGRATGIHLIIVTAHPSRTMLTGLMKVMLPTRLSLKVSTSADSRTILGMDGAERLLGRGDLLYLPAEASQPERIQAAFLSNDEAAALAHYWRQQVAAHHRPTTPNAITLPATQPGWERNKTLSDDADLDDDLLGKAEAIVREYGRASISLLMRRLRIGYTRASHLIGLLEERGIIGPVAPAGQGRDALERKGGAKDEDALDNDLEERARNEFLRSQFLKKQKGQGHFS